MLGSVRLVGYGLFWAYVFIVMFSALRMLVQLTGCDWRRGIRAQAKHMWLWSGCVVVLLFLLSWLFYDAKATAPGLQYGLATKVLACAVSFQILAGGYWVSRSLGRCMSDLGMDEDKTEIVGRSALSTPLNCVLGFLFGSAGLCMLYPQAAKTCFAGIHGATGATVVQLVKSPITYVWLAMFCIGLGTSIVLHVALAALGAERAGTDGVAAAVIRLQRAKRTYFHYALLTLATYATSLMAIPCAGLWQAGSTTVLFAGVVWAVVVIFFFLPQLLIRSRIMCLYDEVSVALKGRILAVLRQPDEADTARAETLSDLLSLQNSLRKEDTRILDPQVMLLVLSSVVIPIVIRLGDLVELIKTFFG